MKFKEDGYSKEDNRVENKCDSYNDNKDYILCKPIVEFFNEERNRADKCYDIYKCGKCCINKH